MDRNATVYGGGGTPSYVFALWNLVIRPPRSIYELSQLGPAEFEVRGVRAVRRDVRLRTARGAWLACSHFVPVQEEGKEFERIPVVVYLHGNSSSRLEAGSLVTTLLERRIALFCFDAAGCGLSEGEYVSLGWHEKDDLAEVIAHLRRSPLCGPIGVWGRSMGAATALMHSDRDPTLGALCLDSPFASLRQLVEELAQSPLIGIPIPEWLVSATFAIIRMRCQTLADFDVEELRPIDHAPKSFVPSLFVHGRSDNFISPKHSRQLFDAYAGDAEFIMVEGDHNTERNHEVVLRAVDFFCRAFRHEATATPEHWVPPQDGRPQRIPRTPAPSGTVRTRQALAAAAVAVKDRRPQEPQDRRPRSASVDPKKSPQRGPKACPQSSPPRPPASPFSPIVAQEPVRANGFGAIEIHPHIGLAERMAAADKSSLAGGSSEGSGSKAESPAKRPRNRRASFGGA